MLRKLKFKFILINLLTITALISICFGTIYIVAQKNIESESIEVLESTIIIPLADGEKQGVVNKPSENKFETPRRDDVAINKSERLSVFSVKIDNTGNMVSVYNYKENLTVENKELLSGYAESALADGQETGVLESLNMRYHVKKDVRYTYISFLDMKQEQEDIMTFVKGFSWILGIAWFVVLIISIVLAYISVRPVEKAWVRQKQFIADASHELKTPLTVIISSTDIMMSDMSEIKPEHRKWLECTKTESERMKELLGGMLYLARSDDEMKGSKDTLAEIFNLSDVLTESVLTFEIQCYEKGKTLEQDIDEDIFIKGNETEIRRLIGIFLDNACKYSDENGTISVSLKNSGGKCTLAFTNTGEPIPSHDIPHLFERFYRASSSRAREEGGYGLGLSIAHAIATKHGGKISVTSGQSGTSFTMKFSKETPSAK